jgi:hypothetical protein
VRSRELRHFVEAVWVDRDYYVHAIADMDETVHAYSVTSRSKRFHPRLRIPGGHGIERRWLIAKIRRSKWGTKRNPVVALRKSRFHELGQLQQGAGWIGAHNWHYFEAYWYGNPGLYQWFIFGINDAGGYGPWSEEMRQTYNWSFGVGEGDVDPRLAVLVATAEADAASAVDSTSTESAETEGVESEDDWDALEEALVESMTAQPPAHWEAFRRKATPNTYTVIGPNFLLGDYPLISNQGLAGFNTRFGVDINLVRTLV